MKRNIINLQNIRLKFDIITDLFLNFKEAQGAAERTLSDYRKTFAEFRTYYQDEYVDENQIKHVLYEYFKGKANKAPATYNRPYACLHSFFNWCVIDRHMQTNPLRETGLKKKKDEGSIRHAEVETLQKLLAYFDQSTYSGLRNYTLTILTLDTGIRPSEALSLTTNRLSGNKLTIPRETAKTRTERILPLSPQTVELLRRLISYKPPEWSGDFIFYTSLGCQMKLDRWEKILGQASKMIGAKITPYTLRHSFAIMYLRNGGNVFTLQEEMGHTELEMTKRYLKLSNQDIEKQHKQSSPIHTLLNAKKRIGRI